MRARQASLRSVKRIMDTIPATQPSAPAQGEVAESPSQVFTPAPQPISVPASDAPPAQSEPVEDAYSDSSSSSAASASDIGGDENKNDSIPTKDTAENLPYFQSHKVVQAGKIKAIEKAGPDAMEVLALDNGTQIGVDDGWLDMYLPDDLRDEAGDNLGYFIRYADGYTSWSPTKAFEEGYSPVVAGIDASENGPDSDLSHIGVDQNEAKPGPFTRLVAALVACINTHCNSAGKDVADTKVAQFKADSALKGHEADRLDKIFKHLQEQPAPVNPIADLPEPPPYVPPFGDTQATVAE